MGGIFPCTAYSSSAVMQQLYRSTFCHGLLSPAQIPVTSHHTADEMQMKQKVSKMGFMRLRMVNMQPGLERNTSNYYQSKSEGRRRDLSVPYLKRDSSSQ